MMHMHSDNAMLIIQSNEHVKIMEFVLFINLTK